MTKKSKGRQKLEMVKMQNEINLQVTFSKRRYGLFKKASELVSLCGAEVALIVFSPGSKVYTFGHPAVQTITQRYLGGAVGLGCGAGGAGAGAAAAVDGLKNFDDDARRAILAVQLGNELNNKESLLENEKKIGEIMGEKIKNSPLYNRWGKASVDEMDPSELFQFKAALEGLKMNIDTMKLKKSMEMMNETVTLPPIPNPFFAGNNDFGDPFFGYNNLNPNDYNFLTPFDPFFSPVPPNQNLGEESSLVGSTTFENNSYPPPLQPTIFANNSYLPETIAFTDNSYPPLETIAFPDSSYPPRELTTFTDNSYLPLEATTFADNSFPPLGSTTFANNSYPPPEATTFADNSCPPLGPTTFADNSYPPSGPTTFADSSYLPPGPTTFPPSGPTTFADSSYPPPGPTTFSKNSYPPPGFLY